MIVHLLLDEKFTAEFMQLVDQEFNQQQKEHVFLIITKHKKLRYPINNDVEKIIIGQNTKDIFKFMSYLKKAERIIVHSLLNPYLIYMLLFLGVCKKVIWIIWGGDLYDYNKEGKVYKAFKTGAIKRFHGAASPIRGDVELARKEYGFKGQYYSCLAYPSNIISPDHQESSITEKKDFTILIGNSADPENRHEYVLEKIKPLKLTGVRLLLPLSYGSKANAEKIEKLYKTEFGENAVCLRAFIPKDDYLQLLSQTDVVLFAHERQQGLGNIIQLIDTGAKIYLEPYVTTYQWLKELNIEVFDLEQSGNDILAPLSEEQKQKNREIIRAAANKDQLIHQLKKMFYE